jgi:hypothetical protein
MNKTICPVGPCKNTNTNRYANSGGGGMTMKKKYAHKFNNVSSGTQFSINGINNRNIYSYIGNPNSVISNDPFSSSNNSLSCKTYDNLVKTSVKNTKGLINSKIRCSPLYSLNCYKNVNKELVERYENGNPVNKHFNSENKDQSFKIKLMKSRCGVDRTNYLQDISNNVGTNNCSNENKVKSSNRVKTLANQCNITKDMNEFVGYTPTYDLYYANSSLFKKIKCQNNPPDAKIIAC